MVNRLVEDLATKVDIAKRCEATLRAVGLWVRGERHGRTPFPARFNRVARGVWLWSEFGVTLMIGYAGLGEIMMAQSFCAWSLVLIKRAWRQRRQFSLG